MGTLIKPTEGMNPDFPFGFDDFITRDFFNWRRLKKMEQTDIPAANIRETKSSFEIELAAPGMKKDDFTIEIQDGMITVSGKSNKSRTEILTQRRISDIIAEFDMLGLINAKVVSKGRYGRTREIKLAIPSQLIGKSKEIIHNCLNI